MEGQGDSVKWEMQGTAGCREHWPKPEHQGLQAGFALQISEWAEKEDSNHRDLFSVGHL